MPGRPHRVKREGSSVLTSAFAWEAIYAREYFRISEKARSRNPKSLPAKSRASQPKISLAKGDEADVRSARCGQFTLFGDRAGIRDEMADEQLPEKRAADSPPG